ncbi:enoyl-CoA hydratase-related protein [Nitratireductor arenosus]|uniref:enoyl-CoA hydratase-related protein n=1 Tax=Nitratireductor arenosus TaxID=2682096 RepID=UPI0018D25D62
MEERKPFVVIRRQAAVATVTLSRPEKRNALGEEMLAEFNDALASFGDDTETRVIVLSAEPPVFSAGAETNVKAGSSDADRRQAFAGRKSQFRRLFERATTALESLEQVTVAKIGGHAVGAGWGLTLACDFRVASDAAQFWIPEVELGVLLGVGTTTRLVRLVGPAKAKEIILLARRHSAASLVEQGLLTEVASPEDLDARTDALVEALVDKPFLPLAQMKSRIDHIARVGTPESASVIETILSRGD